MEENKAELVSRLSFEIAQDLAPGELDLFDDFKDEFLKNPDAFMTGNIQRNKENMLGFGLGGAEPFVIPAILSIVWYVISNVGKPWAEAAIKKFGEKSGENAAAILFKKPPAKEPPSKEPLTKEKIKELREYALSLAKTQNMNEEKVSFIFDAVIGKFSQI